MTFLSIVMALMAAAAAFYLGHALMGRRPNIVITQREKIVTGLLVATIPLCALGLYSVTGHPDMPDMPLQTRPDRPVKQAFDQAYDRMAHMAARLERDGGTVAEWERLGQIAVMLRDVDLAEKAARHLVAQKPADPDYLVMLIQVLLAQSQGQITPEARKYVDELQKIAPNHPVVVTLLAKPPKNPSR